MSIVSGAVTHCAICKAAIERVPGRRPSVYCGPKCRQRAKRLIAADSNSVTARSDKTAGQANRDNVAFCNDPGKTAGQGTFTPAPDAPAPWSTARTTDTQVRGLQKDVSTSKTGFSGDPGTAGARMERDGSDAARDERFGLREALRELSTLARLQKCGLSVLAGGVTPVIRNGRAGYAGVCTCGSVHVCPCCSTSIRRVRQDELDQVGQFWECQSCGLVMMTLTMRHYKWQSLAVLEGQQREAWKIGFGMNAGRAWRSAKQTFGVRGFVRAWEVTHGPNGWHCHYHVLLFLARPLTPARVLKLQRVTFQVWSTALKTVGAYLPVEKGEDGKPVGVKIDAPDRGEAGTLARYLMKGQDGKTRWGVAAELTRLDVKTGKGGHRTPFEIARAAVRPGADPRDIALWREFEQTASGVRSLYWSNGLRKLLKDMGFELDDRRDAEVAAEEAAAGERLACIPAAVWYRHIARHKGRPLALLKAAEKGGVRALRALAESWGLIWGVDVLEPEELPAGALPTADEVLTRLERSNMVARAEVWRRELERQDREARLGRCDYQPGAWTARQAQLEYEAGMAARESTELEEAAAEFLAARDRANAARAAEMAERLARWRQSA